MAVLDDREVADLPLGHPGGRPGKVGVHLDGQDIARHPVATRYRRMSASRPQAAEHRARTGRPRVGRHGRRPNAADAGGHHPIDSRRDRVLRTACDEVDVHHVTDSHQDLPNPLMVTIVA
jgi:hypothetical protein